jgi:hypothetical protein
MDLKDQEKNMERRLKILLITAYAITLSGCASSPKPVEQSSLNIYQKKVLQEDQRTNEILAKAAALSAKSMAVFVRTEQALAQEVLTAEQIRQARFQATYIPVNMEQYVEYAWDSAPEPLLKALADDAGYRLDYVNERPPTPPMSVTASSQSRMISKYIDVIRQQTRGYIKEIYVDDMYRDKVIKVTYSDF